MQFMGRANELVNDIRRELGLSTEDLADRCGYSRTQTNYYCNGQATPPAEFLAAVFELTHDARIPKLTTGRVNVTVRVRPAILGALTTPDALKHAVAARRSQLAAEAAFLDLLDGGIDPTDPGESTRLDEFLRGNDESIAGMEQLGDLVKAIFECKRAANRQYARTNGHSAGKVGK